MTALGPKQLIITADDFGAAPEVNEAVERAHRHGVLDAASLMVSAPAAADAVARARTMPSLRVGLHLVLVDGRPALPAAAIPDLVDRDGLFRTDMARAGAAMFFRPRVRAQLAAEIRAQFEAFAGTGLALDHVNAHKHFHLHPTIAAQIVAIGRDYGMDAVRVPYEPVRVLARLEPASARAGAALLQPLARALASRLRAARIRVPDQVFGLGWSGAMTARRLAGLLENLPPGLTEIYLHPATGPYPGSAVGYRYRDEMAALMHPEIIEMIGKSGIRHGGFADFAPAQ